MTRTSRPALAAGYLVAYAAVQLGLIAVFGYVGPLEIVVAAVLAVPVTIGGARLLAADLEPELDLEFDLAPVGPEVTLPVAAESRSAAAA
ncbi:hypothetical protein [Patulibacter sp.]|uniref:hypothetical protein n=1 Tax=Patulibacter sp. TaxID=1912859 RepID=UPI00271C1094|nr:hypothetical protein [Patulibacter sp.]MDO9409252.1 hypothetical protein [Patulibacter sp.]